MVNLLYNLNRPLKSSTPSLRWFKWMITSCGLEERKKVFKNIPYLTCTKIHFPVAQMYSPSKEVSINCCRFNILLTTQVSHVTNVWWLRSVHGVNWKASFHWHIDTDKQIKVCKETSDIHKDHLYINKRTMVALDCYLGHWFCRCHMLQYWSLLSWHNLRLRCGSCKLIFWHFFIMFC